MVVLWRHGPGAASVPDSSTVRNASPCVNITHLFSFIFERDDAAHGKRERERQVAQRKNERRTIWRTHQVAHDVRFSEARFGNGLAQSCMAIMDVIAATASAAALAATPTSTEVPSSPTIEFKALVPSVLSEQSVISEQKRPAATVIENAAKRLKVSECGDKRNVDVG